MMGVSQSKKSQVKIKILLPKGSRYSHLNVDGEIVLTKDDDFDILCFEINFSGYFPTLARLWPQNHPLIPPTPAVSSGDNCCFDQAP